jgi:hypothetical protein
MFVSMPGVCMHLMPQTDHERRRIWAELWPMARLDECPLARLDECSQALGDLRPKLGGIYSQYSWARHGEQHGQEILGKATAIGKAAYP